MRLWVIFLLCCFSWEVRAQQPSDSLKNRKILVVAGGATGYAVGMAGLYQTWYRNQNSGSFYFFNDNAEWKQMDKFGHLYTAHHLSHALHKSFTWSGYEDQKALLMASITSFGLMLPIEIFDGFSEAYGFSWGDVAANFAGSSLYYTQKYFWTEPRIIPKFSFQRTFYAPQRPGLLGDGWQEEWLKDYNGQTYWFTFNPYFLITGDQDYKWKWLGLSLGYSAYDMIFARDNQNIAAGLQPGRQIFLSVDVDFSKIPTNKRWLKTVFFALNHVKIPAPTLEWIPGKGIRGHYLYF